MVKIAIINIGIGNIFSVKNALMQLGVESEEVETGHGNNKDYDGIILPGVGNFNYAMKKLKEKGIIKWIDDQVTDKTPLLGICLGMQILAEKGEEGGVTNGLGYIPGKTTLLKGGDVRIPHQGWDDLRIIKKDPLFQEMPENPSFYFVHSYFLDADPKAVSSICNYGIRFPASVQKDNIFGVQFHPEKSQKNGTRLLKNFYDYIRR
jgi:glutamine amidotransferase